ncbi:MAG: hypothetical protein IPI35_32340 [Deltaproteobacteria bacterium]|nr:hypothetical protein [Deltaproteobacteria bacterium]
MANALGVLAWSSPGLSGLWWQRKNLAEGLLGAQIKLLVRGGRVPTAAARDAFDAAPGASGILQRRPRGHGLHGPRAARRCDLVWTDRPERAFVGQSGVFMPDSTSCPAPRPAVRARGPAPRPGLWRRRHGRARPAR